MYYNVYINGSTEPFKFKKSASQYNDMHEEEMTNIPFNYKDKRNYDFKVSITYVFFISMIVLSHPSRS